MTDTDQQNGYQFDEEEANNCACGGQTLLMIHRPADEGGCKDPEGREMEWVKALPEGTNREQIFAAMAKADSEISDAKGELEVSFGAALTSAQATIARLYTRVQELERPAIEAKRAEIRASYTELIAHCEQDRDYEGAFEVQCRLRDREEQWQREDAEAGQQ